MVWFILNRLKILKLIWWVFINFWTHLIIFLTISIDKSLLWIPWIPWKEKNRFRLLNVTKFKPVFFYSSSRSLWILSMLNWCFSLVIQWHSVFLFQLIEKIFKFLFLSFHSFLIVCMYGLIGENVRNRN